MINLQIFQTLRLQEALHHPDHWARTKSKISRPFRRRNAFIPPSNISRHHQSPSLQNPKPFSLSFIDFKSKKKTANLNQIDALTDTVRSLSNMKSLFSSLCLNNIRDSHFPHSLSPFHQTISNHRLKPWSTSCSRSHGIMPAKGSVFPTAEGRPLFGEVHVIIGPMFAGKTTALLRRIQLAIDGGR